MDTYEVNTVDAYEIKVGRNSLARVVLDSSMEETLVLDVYLELNAQDATKEDKDMPEDREALLQEATTIFVNAIKSYLESQGIEISNSDFTEVTQDA